MRGDSIRDLYAKSLALLGLGLLGGLGAAVDYWPATLATPAAAALDLRAARLTPIAATALPSEPVVVASAPTAVVVTADTSTVAVEISAPIETVSAPDPALEPVPVPEMPALVPATFTGTDGGAATEVELTAIEVASPMAVPLPTIVPVQASASHPGPLAGIGAGIADGTARVGSAVVDGFKTVGGAVKGAINGLRSHFPFFQTAPRPGVPTATSTGLQ